ncbi:MAG TPA: O-methyltransferase [Flavobacteriaceae bacterium]|nr:O-methyltransferase [Flavobacteriaceae bacterium]
MDFLPEKLSDYVENHSQPEPELLQKLNRETHQKIVQPRMLSGHLQGRVLSLISKLANPKYILEVGTYTGYSALCLAEGMQKSGEIHTIDINEELKTLQRKYFDLSEYGSRIFQHTGNALEIIPGFEKKFDLAFIDADKENYCNYFEMIVPKMNPGGLILTDNVLWSGKVIEPLKADDIDTKGILEFNKLANSDKRVESILLPVRDGVMVSRVV